MQIARIVIAAGVTAGAIACGVNAVSRSSPAADAGATGGVDAGSAAPCLAGGSVEQDAGRDASAASSPADAALPLGASPADGGWSFRVWAPNASQVTVDL